MPLWTESVVVVILGLVPVLEGVPFTHTVVPAEGLTGVILVFKKVSFEALAK